MIIRDRPNGKRQLVIREQGCTRYQLFPEGTTDTDIKEWGLEHLRNHKLGHVPTIAHKTLQKFTLRELIEDCIRAYDIYCKVGRKDKPIGSWPNNKIALQALLKREVALCNKTLDKVSREHDWLPYKENRLNSGAKVGTFLKDAAVIRLVYKHARDKGIPVGHPYTAEDIKGLKKKVGIRQRILIGDERARLLKATETCRGEQQGRLWRAMIITALHTAMRKGAILKMQWRDVDFHNMLLRIRAETTKSDEAHEIPITKYLGANLKAYYDTLKEEDRTPTSPVFQSTYRDKKSGKVQPLPPGAHWQAFDHIRKNAGIEGGIEGVSFHILKHTAVTDFAGILGERETEYMASHTRTGKMTAKYIHDKVRLIASIRAKLDAYYQEDTKTNSSQTMLIPEVVFPDMKKKFLELGKEQDTKWNDRIDNEKLAAFKRNTDDTIAFMGYLSFADTASMFGIALGELLTYIGLKELHLDKDFLAMTRDYVTRELSEYRFSDVEQYTFQWKGSKYEQEVRPGRIEEAKRKVIERRNNKRPAIVPSIRRLRPTNIGIIQTKWEN